MHQLGSTRSASRRDYLLHTPDAFVRTSMPGLVNGEAVVHVAPQMGARFAMTTAELGAEGRLGAGPAPRFVYVLEGLVELGGSAPQQELGPGAYAYLPGQGFEVTAKAKARLLLFEKPFAALHRDGIAVPSPGLLLGQEAEVAPVPLAGDQGIEVRALLPADPAFDFAINTMTYAPGAALSQVEVHYMEHGLLMLEGGGIYRLGADWHPVAAGDAIWMATFCPQWFAAVGKRAAKYIIYKDVNRHVLG